MTEVSCSRCGSTARGLARAPLPGAAGEAVLAQSCESCWREWLELQVKLINENRLTPANHEHFELLVREMRTFLNLREG
jgi:Fe-S cluster biosynthesis and repair protein YggX